VRIDLLRTARREELRNTVRLSIVRPVGGTPVSVYLSKEEARQLAESVLATVDR
jgi:hypothetical protein